MKRTRSSRSRSAPTRSSRLRSAPTTITRSSPNPSPKKMEKIDPTGKLGDVSDILKAFYGNDNLFESLKTCSSVEFDKLLGKGTYGKVYALKDPYKHLVAKTMLVKGKNHECKIVNDGYRCPSEFISELIIHAILSEGVKKGDTQHFPIISAYSKCNNDLQLYIEKIDTALDTFLIPNQFKQLMGREITKVDIVSMFLQTLMGIVYMNDLGIIHNDMKLDNIFVKKTGLTNPFKYNVYGNRYTVPNTGFTIKIGDFGLATKYSNKQIGRDEILKAESNKEYTCAGYTNTFNGTYDLQVFLIFFVDALNNIGYKSDVTTIFCESLVYMYKHSPFGRENDYAIKHCHALYTDCTTYQRPTKQYHTSITPKMFLLKYYNVLTKN